MTLLLREANADCDAEYLAEALLACLGVDYFLYLREGREMTLDRVKAGWGELVRRLIPLPSAPPSAADRRQRAERPRS